jgi:putative membrane protein
MRIIVVMISPFLRSPAAKLRRSLSVHKHWVKHTKSVILCELSPVMHAHLELFAQRGFMKPGWDGLIPGFLSNLQSSEEELIRLSKTALAFAYQAHLRICTWLYLLIFPVTMYRDLGRWVILAKAVLAFTLLGMLEIACELYALPLRI